MSLEIDREDILLLLLDANERLFKRPSFNGVTRLEKMVFLLGFEEKVPEVEQLFSFRAYKFGPYSKALYEASEFLQSTELVRVENRPYYSYFLAEEQKEFERDIEPEEDSQDISTAQERLFILTDTGRTLARKLRAVWAEEYPSYLKKIDDVVRKYGDLPLNQIIRYVYRRFPKMAERSIHPEAARIPGR
jgi:uncharacterized protein YwgA